MVVVPAPPAELVPVESHNRHYSTCDTIVGLLSGIIVGLLSGIIVGLSSSIIIMKLVK